MISARKLSGVAAALHFAPLGETNWRAFLNGLCEELRAAQGLFIAGQVNRSVSQILPQVDLESPLSQQLYNQYYGQLDPRREAFRRKPRIGLIISEALVRPEDFRNPSNFGPVISAGSSTVVMTASSGLRERSRRSISQSRIPNRPLLAEKSRSELSLYR